MIVGLLGKVWDGLGDCEGIWLGIIVCLDLEVIGGESYNFFILNRFIFEIKFDIFNFIYIFVLIYLVNDDRRKVIILFILFVFKLFLIFLIEVLFNIVII